MSAVFPVVSRRSVPAGSGRNPRPASPVKRSAILRPGLSLHLGEAVEHADATGQSMDESRMRIVIVLGGGVELAYGHSGLRLGAQQGRADADAAIIAMRAPAECLRTARRGDYSRRISIGLGRDWIEQAMPDGGDAPLRRRLEVRCWKTSAHARALAEQLFRPPPLVPAVAGLYLESRTIDLVFEALTRREAGDAAAAPVGGLLPAAFRRMCEVREFIEVHATEIADVAAIAGHAGLSVATLQRHFRMAHGMTMLECIQRTRLRKARDALERDGVDVRRAALIAGYASPANFATAFRRRYGLPPSKVRPRV